MSDFPAIETMKYVSEALVNTDRPERYAKQLASHLGHKITCEEIADGYRLTFNRDGHFNGYGDVLVLDEGDAFRLTLCAYAPDAECLERIEGILGRHLERFGERDGLKVVFG